MRLILRGYIQDTRIERNKVRVCVILFFNMGLETTAAEDDPFRLVLPVLVDDLDSGTTHLMKYTAIPMAIDVQYLDLLLVAELILVRAEAMVDVSLVLLVGAKRLVFLFFRIPCATAFSMKRGRLTRFGRTTSSFLRRTGFVHLSEESFAKGMCFLDPKVSASGTESRWTEGGVLVCADAIYTEIGVIRWRNHQRISVQGTQRACVVKETALLRLPPIKLSIVRMR